MAASYDRVNVVTSFGFSRRWRRQAVSRLDIGAGSTVLDAMTGAGEGWPYLADRIGNGGRIVAIDLSPGMLALARRRTVKSTLDVRLGDVLTTGLPDGSCDAVLSLFGIKTLSPAQRAAFATEIARVLRPGGCFSMVEVSVPGAPALRIAYGFYLRRVIPVLGRLLLGDPATYRMLGVYTDRFGDARAMTGAMRVAGLEAEFVSYFFGCATGLVGRKKVSGP